MATNTNIAHFEQNQSELTELHIKAIMHKVNDRLSYIFSGKITDIHSLHSAVVWRPTGKVLRVWHDIQKRYPGLRDLLLNQK